MNDLDLPELAIFRRFPTPENLDVLRGKRCYLSGAIQHDTTHFNWRIEPKKVLTERFGIDLFDPFADPKQICVDALNKAMEEENFDEIARIAKSFMKKDLAMVDRSDLLIAYLPYKVPTTGTIHEIVVATNAKKPVLLVCPEGRAKIPIWLYGFIPHKCMFGSWEDLYSHLDDVNHGWHKDNSRWHFIYGMV